MKQNKIKLLVFCMIIIILPAFLIGYQFHLFKQPRNEYKKIIIELPDDYKNMHKELKDLILNIEGINRVKYYLSIQLVQQYNSSISNPRTSYKIRRWIWQTLLEIYFNEDEIISLWCFYAPYFKGQGLIGAARYEFGKDLTQLSFEELVALIANARAPLYYKNNPLKLKRRINEALKNLEEK